MSAAVIVAAIEAVVVVTAMVAVRRARRVAAECKRRAEKAERTEQTQTVSLSQARGDRDAWHADSDMWRERATERADLIADMVPHLRRGGASPRLRRRAAAPPTSA